MDAESPTTARRTSGWPAPAEGVSREEHRRWLYEEYRGWVYVLCLGEPRALRDVDYWPHSMLVSHYVGWTSQNPPMKRPMQHGRGLATRVVLLVPGTMRDEEDMKVSGTCPLCGGSLNYHREAWDRHGKQLPAEERRALKRAAFQEAERPAPW